LTDAAAALASAASAIDRLVADAVSNDAVLDEGPPAVAAGGPRTAADPDSYRLALEQIREGHLLHNGGGRVVVAVDPDLGLLAGDALYAGGLGIVARLGDGEAISELSDLIASCAVAKAAGRPADAEAAWSRACASIGGQA